MIRPRNFKQLHIFKLAYKFTLDIYPIIDKLPEKEQRNLSNQLKRATTSIVLNIAEGSGSTYNKAFLSYLNIAYASSKEVEVCLMLCKDLGYIDKLTFNRLIKKLEHLKILLFKFMKGLENTIKNNHTNINYNSFNKKLKKKFKN